MKKIKRVFSNLYVGRTLILSIIFVLIFLLSNKSMTFSCSGYETHLCKLIITFFLLFVLLIVYLIITPEKSVSVVIRNLVAGKFYGLYGIFGLIFTLSILGWFADSLFNIGSLKVSEIIYPLIIFINIFIFGLTFLIFYPRDRKKHKGDFPEKRKVLIMALSFWKGINDRKNVELVRKIIESNCIDQYPDGNCGKLGNISFNWQLPLRALKYHSSVLEKAIFLVSKESNEQWEDFLCFLKILDTNLLEKVEKTRPLNFNDSDEISEELRKILKSLLREGYKDEDISVNISSGTSAVTLCLTLFALEEKRQIEYFTQFEIPAKHKKFSISKEDAITFLKSLTLD